MMKTLRVLQLLSLCAIGAAATGCASVKVSVPGMGNQNQVASLKSERVALTAATRDLADTPWSDADGGGMMSVMFGTVGENRRDRAVAEYLSAIEGTPSDRLSTVLADADHALAQARRVAEAGRQAVTAITPVENDIDTLEAAIGDVRECRTMYTRALDELAEDGAPVTRAEVRVVRDAFTQTINDIGHTADIVASRVRASRDQSQHADRRVEFGSGDL